MTLTTFASPSSLADVIDKVADELETNHNWDQEEDSGSVSAGTIERWLSRPSDETVNGQRITAGMRITSGDIEINTLYDDGLDYDDSTSFRRKVGQPRIETTRDGGYIRIGNSSGRTTINNAYLITPDDTAADSDDHQYFYVIIQADTVYWFQFGFGELDKTGVTLTYTGGNFMTASDLGSSGQVVTASINNIFGGRGTIDTRSPSVSNLRSYINTTSIYTGTLGGVSAALGWSFAKAIYTVPNTNVGNTIITNAVNDMEGLIQDAGYSTVGYHFSMPIECYVRYVGNTDSHVFIGTYPNVRAGNVRGRTLGSTFTQSSVTYFPVPFYAAEGNTGHSGGYGLYFIT